MDTDADLTSLQNIRGNRRFIVELIVFAVFLGLAINLFSSFILNFFDSREPDSAVWGWATLLTGAAIVFICLAAFVCLCFRQKVEYFEIAPTLAVQVDEGNQRVEFPGHSSYEVAQTAHKLHNYAAGVIDAKFCAHWPGAAPISQKDFAPGHVCWDLLADMVEANLMLLLRKYARYTLTHSAMFRAEFRLIANAIPKEEVQFIHLPYRVRSNVFLIGQKIEKILVPKGSRFSVNFYRAPESNRQYARALTLLGPRGSVTFAVSRYWTVLGDKETAAREFPTADPASTVFIRIPVDIRLAFSSGFRRYTQVQNNYLWFKKLIDNAQRRLDWGAFLMCKRNDRQP